jgi:P-type Cu2+ transporter
MDGNGGHHTVQGHGAGHRHAPHAGHGKRPTVVLHVGGLYRGSEKAVVETALGRRPGVLRVEANPVAQTATVTYDAGRTSVAELQQWVQECGYHCAGQ